MLDNISGLSNMSLKSNTEYSCVCHTAFTAVGAPSCSHVLAESVVKSEPAVNAIHFPENGWLVNVQLVTNKSD